jgi:hypothetical protein
MKTVVEINDYITKLLKGNTVATKTLGIGINPKRIKDTLVDEMRTKRYKNKTPLFVKMKNQPEYDFASVIDYQMVTNAQLEKRLLQLILRSKFETLQSTTGRYHFDFTQLSSRALVLLINHILNSEEARINLSWVEPLQNLLLDKQLNPVVKKLRRGVKSYSMEEDLPQPAQWNPNPGKAKVIFDNMVYGSAGVAPAGMDFATNLKPKVPKQKPYGNSQFNTKSYTEQLLNNWYDKAQMELDNGGVSEETNQKVKFYEALLGKQEAAAGFKLVGEEDHNEVKPPEDETW